MATKPTVRVRASTKTKLTDFSQLNLSMNLNFFQF